MGRNTIRKVLRWSAAALLGAVAVVFKGVPGGLLIMAALLIIPIERSERFFDWFIEWKWLIVVLLIAAALCLVLFAPSVNSHNDISSFDPTFFLE